MKISANFKKFNDGNSTEMDYILIKFLQDLRDRKKPLMIPSIEFISDHFNRSENEYLYNVKENGDLFLTSLGELMLVHLEKEACYNIKHLKVSF